MCELLGLGRCPDIDYIYSGDESLLHPPERTLDLIDYERMSIEEENDTDIAAAYAELDQVSDEDEIDRLADEDPFAHQDDYEEIEKDLSRERGKGKKF